MWICEDASFLTLLMNLLHLPSVVPRFSGCEQRSGQVQLLRPEGKYYLNTPLPSNLLNK